MSRAPGEGAPAALRIEEAALLAHHRRMRSIAVALLASSLLVGVGAPWISTWLGLFSAASVAGLIISISMLVRARRGLAHRGALEVRIEGQLLTAGHEGSAPFLAGVRVLGGQAFGDHLQLVCSDPGTRRIAQLELPIAGEACDRFLAGAGLQVPRRAGFVTNLAIAFALVPAIAMLALLAWRALTLVLLVGVIAGLKQLDPALGLGALLGLALLGAYLFVARRARAGTMRDP